MDNLIKIDYEKKTVYARDIYIYLFGTGDSKTVFSTWFSRTAKKYGFERGKDFISILEESTGGRKKTNHVVTIEMAKELAMITPNEKGKKVRQYFLKCEDLLKEMSTSQEAERLASKKIRRTLTDSVTESGENERMHGHGFSTYTLMIYEIVGIKPKYKEFRSGLKRDRDYMPRIAFRDTLTPDELKRVETAEALVKPLLDLEKKYPEIKETLKPLFEIKKLDDK